MSLLIFVAFSRGATERNADRALYRKFKENLDYFANITLVDGVRTRLSDENPEVMLYDYGYLSIKSTSVEEADDDGFCTLYFPSIEAEIAMITDLVSGAELEDVVVGDALSVMRKSFAREPPDVQGFTFIMQGLGTIIRRLPYVSFPDRMFYRLAVLGALRRCGLQSRFGDTPIDGGTVYCDHVLNDTRLMFEMHFERDDAQQVWNSDFKNRLKITIHSRLPRRKMLASLIMFTGEQYNPIHDWYGQYLFFDPDDNHTLFVEYKNPALQSGSTEANMYGQLFVG